jgi:hypothetical protein
MTKTAKPTPGPWAYHVDDEGVAVVFPADATRSTSERAICDCWTRRDENGRHWTDAEANARLIAAAPELLAALDWLYAALVHDRNRNLPYWQEARAALAKARDATS